MRLTDRGWFVLTVLMGLIAFTAAFFIIPVMGYFG